MAGLKGQPAPKPSNLADPVPGAGEDSEADLFIANYKAKAMPQAAPQDEASPEEDQFVQQALQNLSPPGEDQFAQEPGFVDANVEQFKNFTTRLQAGLAANDTEKLSFLKKKFGDQNAVIKGDKLYFRRSVDEKFKPLDPDTFEVIADIIPDFAREIVTEVALAPGEAAGAAAGLFAGGPFAPATAAAGAMAGRVGSIPMANRFADTVAEAAGIPQDPNRDIRQENLIGMGAETALPVVGKVIGKQIAKRIPGTLAYKEAIAAGKKESVALTEQSKEVVNALEALEKDYINVPMTSYQVHPDSPQLLQKFNDAKMNFPGQIKQRENEAAQAVTGAINNTLDVLARRSGMGPVKSEAVPRIITNAVEAIDKSEGKAIGAFRAKAMAKLGNQKQQLPAETSQTAVEIMRELGFTQKKQTLSTVTRSGSFEGAAARGGVQVPNKITRYVWVPPKDIQGVIGRMGLDESQTRSVINIINEYGQIITRGNEARLPDIERLISRMGPLNRKLGGTGIAAKWGKMTGELRQLRRDVIGNALEDPAEKVAFNRTMDDFRMIRENTDQLSNILRADVTTKSLVNSIFTGKENLANIRAIKSLVGADSAEWGHLREAFTDKLMLDAASTMSKTGKPISYDSKKMMNDLTKKYGDEFLGEVFTGASGKKNLDQLKNALTVGIRLQETITKVNPDLADEKVKRGATQALLGWLAGFNSRMMNGAVEILGATSGREKGLLEILNREGYEKYLPEFKGDKGLVAKNMEILLEAYNSARAGSRVMERAEEVVKRGTKAGLRQEAQEMAR